MGVHYELNFHQTNMKAVILLFLLVLVNFCSTQDNDLTNKETNSLIAVETMQDIRIQRDAGNKVKNKKKNRKNKSKMNHQKKNKKKASKSGKNNKNKSGRGKGGVKRKTKTKQKGRSGKKENKRKNNNTKSKKKKTKKKGRRSKSKKNNTKGKRKENKQKVRQKSRKKNLARKERKKANKKPKSTKKLGDARKPYKGSHCQYIDLCALDTKASKGCKDGEKFVVKGARNGKIKTRRQFLILQGKKIIAFLENGKKITDCKGNLTDVTNRVTCKA